MTRTRPHWIRGLAAVAALSGLANHALAAPTVSRLTPPSELFRGNPEGPVVARFLPDQRFDLQATIRPDAPEKTITRASFAIDDKPVAPPVSIMTCEKACVKDVPENAAIVSSRAVTVSKPGLHRFSVTATQSDGQTVTATGNFEVVPLVAGGKKVKNIILLVGDGMGASHRTAARIVAKGYSQGKSNMPLAMDTMPVTGMVKTASLNSIVTDSAPGMTAYVSGNKNDNNQEGVFPDDTLDHFDNPRIEYLSEYLHRTQGKALGIVTTADVFDATPAGNAVHTSNRGAGTGIVDQFFDDRQNTGLQVLMGGGRKWFLPAATPGSARGDKTDYQFSMASPHTAQIVERWKAAEGRLDKDRDLIADFQKAGFAYAEDRKAMDQITKSDKLLGLFAHSNMNVALDKINGRRNQGQGLATNEKAPGTMNRVVDDFGFPDQPMLEEMAQKAIEVLQKSPKGFVLMVEGASIDKQAHAMDSDRWVMDTIEFDRAVQVALDYAEKAGDTLVIVTADHECAGASLIGASRLTDSKLQGLIAQGVGAALRDQVVGVYEQAGFPRYRLLPDGYPETMDIDRRMLVGYGANADRMEDFRTNALPLQDSQQPFVKAFPLSGYPANATKRDPSGYLVTGQVPGDSAVHTATDIPLSAAGPGAYAFTGVIDNTDVFFKLVQAASRGTIGPSARPTKP